MSLFYQIGTNLWNKDFFLTILGNSQPVGGDWIWISW